MPVDFGVALIEKHYPTHQTQWMDDLDVLLPKLEGHFKSLWMTDHLFWGDMAVYEVWTGLSYLAARWQSFDVGPMVMGQNYRNPALLAKMGATLQLFSRGRFIMGVGAGWKEDEYRAYNYDFPSAGVRVDQFEDTLEIIKRLWSEPGKVTFQGKHYAIFDAYCEPKPDPVPPIVLGGRGDRMLGIIAKYADWWNLSDVGLTYFKERRDILHQRCEDIGRDPASIRKTWFGRVATGSTHDEVNARANSRATKYTTENGFVGTAPQIVEQMQGFVAAGVDYFMIDVLDIENPDVLGVLLEDVLPHVKGG